MLLLYWLQAYLTLGSMRLSRYAQCYVAFHVPCSLFDDRPSCPMRAEYGHGSQITLSSNVGPMVLFYYYLTLPSGGSSVTESMLIDVPKHKLLAPYSASFFATAKQRILQWV